MSFRLKTILGIAAIEITLLAILVFSGLSYLRHSSETELFTRGGVTAQLLSTMTSDAVVSLDLATLDSLVAQTLTNNELVYVRVRNRNGIVLAEGGDAAALEAAFAPDDSVEAARADGRLDVASPILAAGETFGRVEIGLSIDRLDLVIAEARRWMLTIAVSEILVVALFGAMLGTVLTRQLARLRRGARRVATGEFGHQLPVRGRDELADTTVSFNRMSAALAAFAQEAQDARERAEKGRAYAESVLNDAMNSMPQAVVIADAEERVTFVNRSFRRRYPNAVSAAEDRPFAEIAAATLAPFEEADGRRTPFSLNQRLARFHAPEDHPSWRTQLDNGRTLMTSQRRMSDGGVVVVEQDITDLYEALERNRLLEMELMQTQKMEALGTMAGGIAHEINTPVQFVGNNLSFLADTFEDVTASLDSLAASDDPAASALRRKLEAIDWDFAREEIPSALSEAQNGVRSIGDIVRSIKAFAHPDADVAEPQDLKAIIENTLTVSRNEWKHHADVSLAVEGDVSAVPCFAGKLSQVFINLVVNAAQAIADQKRAEKGVIDIRVRQLGDAVEIAIADDGPGVPADKTDKIFELFFTTKAPGQGTGQGLAISRRIIEINHGGTLGLDPDAQNGARFVMNLPLQAVAA